MGGRPTAWPWFVLAIALAVGLATPAQGAFPGSNGKIAFQTGGSSIYTPGNMIEVINPDGTGRATLTTGYNPTWSPDGARIAFLRGDGLYLANADGSNAALIVPGGTRMADPAWSPDGTQLAFVREGACDPHESSCYPNRLFIVNADGTGAYQVAAGYRPSEPDWSPDGSMFIGTDDGGAETNRSLFTVNVDGSNRQSLTSTSQQNDHPTWSPDGSRYLWGRLAFDCCQASGTFVTSPSVQLHARKLLYPGAWAPDGSRIVMSLCADTSYPCGTDLFLVDPDGGNLVKLTDDASIEAHPTWQPIPVNAYPRPKGASPMEISLVPAYEPCTSPNRTHGPPLAFPVCAPPQRTPGQLTIGTADSNGRPTKSVSIVQIGVRPGSPSTPADEADLRLYGTVNDVRLASDLSDFTARSRRA